MEYAVLDLGTGCMNLFENEELAKSYLCNLSTRQGYVEFSTNADYETYADLDMLDKTCIILKAKEVQGNADFTLYNNSDVAQPFYYAAEYQNGLLNDYITMNTDEVFTYQVV